MFWHFQGKLNNYVINLVLFVLKIYFCRLIKFILETKISRRPPQYFDVKCRISEEHKPKSDTIN